MSIFDKFILLKIDTTAIGLIQHNLETTYFCTPIGANILGWTGCDGIHFCMIEDFLRLIITCGDTSILEQVCYWTKEQFETFYWKIMQLMSKARS